MHARSVSGRCGIRRTRTWVFATLLLGTALAGVGCASSESSPDEPGTGAGSREMERFGLATDTSKRSVELDEFLSGGPPKDGIPALTEPTFDGLGDSTVPDDVYGVLVEIGGNTRFYPYNVMVWHEIVNDIVGGRPVAVTF